MPSIYMPTQDERVRIDSTRSPGKPASENGSTCGITSGSINTVMVGKFCTEVPNLLHAEIMHGILVHRPGCTAGAEMGQRYSGH